MQKLIILQLKATPGDLQEVLSDYLQDGWQIVSVSTAGAGENTYRSFLVAVVLEQSPTP